MHYPSFIWSYWCANVKIIVHRSAVRMNERDKENRLYFIYSKWDFAFRLEEKGNIRVETGRQRRLTSSNAWDKYELDCVWWWWLLVAKYWFLLCNYHLCIPFAVTFLSLRIIFLCLSKIALQAFGARCKNMAKIPPAENIRLFSLFVRGRIPIFL